MSTVSELVEQTQRDAEAACAAVDADTSLSDAERQRRKAVIQDDADDMIARLLS